MQYSYFDISSESFQDWRSLCPVGEYRVLPAGSMPAIVPAGLMQKADSIVIVASGTQEGTAFYMVNINRVDHRAQAIDQQPFLLAFVGTLPVGSGVLVHHGNWTDRTTRPPAAFWHYMQHSGIGAVWSISTLPVNSAGSLSELANPSHGSAFRAGLSEIQRILGESTE
jgi:hypothetical protein